MTHPDDATRAEEQAEEAAALIADISDESMQVQAAQTLSTFRLGWKAGAQHAGLCGGATPSPTFPQDDGSASNRA